MREYAAIAQVVYRTGMWKGSFGLRSITFVAASKTAAIRHARRVYAAEWLKEKKQASQPMKLLKLHVHVEAL